MSEEIINHMDFDALAKRREQYFRDNPKALEALNNCSTSDYDITVMTKDSIETIHIKKEQE